MAHSGSLDADRHRLLTSRLGSEREPPDLQAEGGRQTLEVHLGPAHTRLRWRGRGLGDKSSIQDTVPLG